MSASSGEEFPHRWVVGEGEEPLPEEVWYALSVEERWQHSMAALRRLDEVHGLEFSPQTLAAVHFGEPISGFDLRAALVEVLEQERLAVP